MVVVRFRVPWGAWCWRPGNTVNGLRITAANLLVAMVVAMGGCSSATPTAQRQLITAAMNGDLAKVESLLTDPNVDINSTGLSRENGETALGSAVAFNRVAQQYRHADAADLLMSYQPTSSKRPALD
jgi:hypothetical protein